MPPLSLSIKDINAFADLGTQVVTERNEFTVTRNGDRYTVTENGQSYTVTTSNGAEKTFPNAGALLVDPAFADLPRIAKNQVVLLSPQRIGDSPVPIVGELKSIVGNSSPFAIEQGQTPWFALDQWLANQQGSSNQDGTDLLLIDGPAGVGKTTVVREAALLRAEYYDGSAPLILQIASRGRVLQNIADLIAFALQDVRSNLTIGQLMSLVRHGLIILAIDGFDELSDPNGFETAWSGLNGLIADSRGVATFLLAGRETFVSTELMQRQLTSFNTENDRLSALTLGDPDPVAAKNWLLQNPGWDHTLLGRKFVEPIFDHGSYALRPFFLDVIAREPAALASDEPPASDLLSYLVQIMLRREAKKFIEALDPPGGPDNTQDYETYVGRFLEEVARDLAENQSEALADDALDLLATVAADGLLPDDQVAAVVQRARTVVFLANDLRAGHVRFAHEQLLQHFLAREALRSVSEGETPRYVRRNLFGRDALEVFAHVARGRHDVSERFLNSVRAGIAQPSRDRTNTNLSVLGVAAACGTAVESADLQIRDVGINELYFPFSAPIGISFRDTAISILYAASADLRNVVFESGVHISTLEVDRRTQLPVQLPQPQMLVHAGGTTSDPSEIQDILNPDAQQSAAHLDWSDDLFEILGRIERYRTFWLRTNLDDTDHQGRRIVTHPSWPSVYSALRSLDLVTVKTKQASGPYAEFIHFRQDVILTEHKDLFRALNG
ncbi:NACHT domain-containing protein [Palleronia sediminis]|uniref:NACHT domain-containing protein n=1 Tax=Palleronia sediminis TaxID=2547833 RepID=A0A4R6AKR7_9RHOB|nr:ATP-binding protein [Palleronia sediminis]TDL84005.1 NACHT domain-containing protein [Palleronia sediminis]